MRCQLMKRYSVYFTISLFLLSLNASAGWQVQKPELVIPREPFFQAGNKPKTVLVPSSYSAAAFPNQYATLGQPTAVYAVSMSGSLKENLERIMGRYHWRVVWKAPFDYNFDGKVTGASLPSIVAKLLKPFPLQAQMYVSNRTLIVVPRDNKG